MKRRAMIETTDQSAVPPGDPDANDERVLRTQFRRFVLNLVVIILTGVLISTWLVEYTDFFPTVGGLLGLGGVFAWIAFLSNLVSDDRKKEMQAALEKRVLLGRWAAVFALVVMLAFAIFAYTRGTLVLVGANDGQKRAVEVFRTGKKLATIDVPAGESTRTSVFVQPPAELTLKSPGLPPLAVTLEHLRRTTIHLPQSFTGQPILLASMPPDLALSASGASVEVLIKRKSTQQWARYGGIKAGLYAGESIWIGCGNDVVVPQTVKTDWLTYPSASSAVQRRWGKTVSAGVAPLNEGDAIKIVVTNSGGGPMAAGDADILSPKSQPFPQLLQLAVSQGGN
jgi:hypothetical protein